MQKLTELIKQNNHLRFFDADKKESLNVSEIFIDTEFLVSKNKKLAFLYIDNSLDSVWIFLNFMDSNHALVLLSPQLNSEFKTRLESIYKPYYIYDKKREHINNYKIYNLFDSVQVHYSNQSVKVNIHPLVKVLLSTSGSTGSPKFVKLSEKNIVSNAKSIIDYLPIMKEDITPLNLPIYYSYGLSIMTTNSIAGGQIVCTNKDVLNKEFWLDFNKYKYTSLAGVPYLYEILNRIGFTKKQYPSLRYLTQAGGKLNIRLVEIFTNYSKQNNVEFYVMYGQTEATARMSYLDPKFLFEKISSIGKAIKDGSFTIDNDLGELHYTGPNVFGGYAEKIKDLNSYNENNYIKLLETKELEWQLPYEKQVFEHDGEMYKIETEKSNLLVSPKHKVYASKKENHISNTTINELFTRII